MVNNITLYLLPRSSVLRKWSLPGSGGNIKIALTLIITPKKARDGAAYITKSILEHFNGFLSN